MKVDLWGYGVAFKGGSKLADTAKVLRQLTSSAKIFDWTIFISDQPWKDF